MQRGIYLRYIYNSSPAPLFKPTQSSVEERGGRTEDQPEPHSAAASHLHRLPASHRSCCRPLLSPLKPSPPPPACPPSRRLPSGYAPRCLCRHRFLPRFHILPMRSCWEALDLFLVFSGFFLLWWYGGGGGGVCVEVEPPFARFGVHSLPSCRRFTSFFFFPCFLLDLLPSFSVDSGSRLYLALLLLFNGLLLRLTKISASIVAAPSCLFALMSCVISERILMYPPLSPSQMRSGATWAAEAWSA